jgi:hypothetical protein
MQVIANIIVIVFVSMMLGAVYQFIKGYIDHNNRYR